jgi:hypothetical protein
MGSIATVAVGGRRARYAPLGTATPAALADHGHDLCQCIRRRSLSAPTRASGTSKSTTDAPDGLGGPHQRRALYGVRDHTASATLPHCTSRANAVTLWDHACQLFQKGVRARPQP